MNKRAVWKTIESWRYPLLILFVGIALMLIPVSGKEEAADSWTDEPLAVLLSETQGVGKAYVLISDSGVVVVCAGAANPAVRLDIIHAVSSYTGFGADKITILKLKS